MDSRTAAHVLGQIAAFLELGGANKFKARAYQVAARGLLALGADDLAPMLRSGELERVRGLGPATLAVVRDLVETGESRYLEELRAATPEGLLELMRVPSLSIEKIHKLHATLGISSLAELEEAAQDGRLTKMKGWGPKTAARILAGIAFMKDAGVLRLYPHVLPEATALLASVRSHPDIVRAELAGSMRRRREVISDVDVVAACSRAPEEVAQSFTRTPGVRSTAGTGASVSIYYMDGTKLDLYCVTPEAFAVVFWRVTGNADHVDQVLRRLQGPPRGITVSDETLTDAMGRAIPCPDERSIYEAAGLEWVPPELREGLGEVGAAESRSLPRLVEVDDLRGVLHCHSLYSDGRASIAEMAQAARAKGWSYIGISDHSQAAFYASGVSPENMLRQHDEIDELNDSLDGFRVLKGVEADILADGRLDYDAELLDRFDYVIASIHSRFKMDGAAMTNRVLRAMDDPHTTILAHPTGRLLLSRDAYAIDVDAVLQKAAEVGVAVELNADPHRLDLDWRYLPRAKELGVTIEIGPDAHSRGSLEWTELGVAMARKGWLESTDVLNARDAADVIAFAERRHV
jgi:DNA polymerase (family 10)